MKTFQLLKYFMLLTESTLFENIIIFFKKNYCNLIDLISIVPVTEIDYT